MTTVDLPPQRQPFSDAQLLVSFMVHGIPAKQGDKQINRKTGHMYEKNPGLGAWRGQVIAAAGAKLGARAPATRPCVTELMFYFKRPVSHYRTGKNAGVLRDAAPKFHAQTPDIDKLCRAALDALTYAGVWVDDKQAHAVLLTREWTDRFKGQPGMYVRVWEEQSL